MWVCENCGCQGIAHDLEFCPVCRTPRSVATEPGQPSEESLSAGEGGSSPATDSSPSRSSGDASGAASSSLTKTDKDWGK